MQAQVKSDLLTLSHALRKSHQQVRSEKPEEYSRIDTLRKAKMSKQ